MTNVHHNLFHTPTAQAQTKFPKIAFRTLLYLMFKLLTIFASILLLDFLQMLRLPVKTHKPADQEFSTIFTRLVDGLVEEKSVADRTVEDAVEDMSEGFSLWGTNVSETHEKGAGRGQKVERGKRNN